MYFHYWQKTKPDRLRGRGRWIGKWWMAGCFCFTLLIGHTVGAGESWEQALAQMPLKKAVRQLNRTNCVELMLAAFQSNAIVKALIFMPGATDEFYMFRRAKAELAGATPSLLDAVSVLTNQTFIRATFRAPLLLLHTDEDPLDPDGKQEHAGTVEELRRLRTVAHVLWNDRDWDAVQPLLRARLKVDLRPWRGSKESWHFYRHSLAGWNLNGYEALEATALAGKSRFLVRRGQVIFEPDPRVRGTPPGAEVQSPKSKVQAPKSDVQRPRSTVHGPRSTVQS